MNSFPNGQAKNIYNHFKDPLRVIYYEKHLEQYKKLLHYARWKLPCRPTYFFWHPRSRYTIVYINRRLAY